ncbi:MAG TPA: hypothetical protein VE963_19805 [Reyranella sp.]|nr:hypothetical protein [Reyranella sp.]
MAVPKAETIDVKVGLVCIAALELAACATDTTLGQSASPRVVTEGRSVYVVNVSTEQEGRASAVSICRQRGGTAVFSEIVQYRHKHTVSTAAHFDCTI